MARRWVITGASRGIGAAVAEAAVGAGDEVVLVARGEAVTEVAERLTRDGAKAFAVRTDVTADGAAAEIVREATEKLGGIDVLVNNAALHIGGRITRLEEGAFESVVDADLVAPFRLCRAVVEEMEPGGAIVNIGAVVGLRGFPGDAPYASAKAGLVGLTLVLAIELGRRGITANCVVPGFTETEMTGGLDDRAREMLLGRIPVGRPAEAKEIAEVVRWVAQTPYMTGAVVPVDGGLMAALGSVR
jgi:3-oxoacyl-[acyl-carrier protein] reductase